MDRALILLLTAKAALLGGVLAVGALRGAGSSSVEPLDPPPPVSQPAPELDALADLDSGAPG